MKKGFSLFEMIIVVLLLGVFVTFFVKILPLYSLRTTESRYLIMSDYVDNVFFEHVARSQNLVLNTSLDLTPNLSNPVNFYNPKINETYYYNILESLQTNDVCQSDFNIGYTVRICTTTDCSKYSDISDVAMLVSLNDSKIIQNFPTKSIKDKTEMIKIPYGGLNKVLFYTVGELKHMFKCTVNTLPMFDVPVILRKTNTTITTPYSYGPNYKYCLQTFDKFYVYLSLKDTPPMQCIVDEKYTIQLWKSYNEPIQLVASPRNKSYLYGILYQLDGGIVRAVQIVIPTKLQ